MHCRCVKQCVSGKRNRTQIELCYQYKNKAVAEMQLASTRVSSISCVQ